LFLSGEFAAGFEPAALGCDFGYGNDGTSHNKWTLHEKAASLG
jgi:hypothetical protein